ncbi:HlyD family efflux transporter periplasmic adaptor subunit [Paractinoplanes ferrugineus]|uniref:RND transporter n=1 Tax=Paractinoplanes ferrugineus TaxID=113564 RepID=A0A919JCB2_9ACTN|nr:efflux RND transporter periplasmic adaptor subunit [Actinoplanes ferrugineus]GIE14541.1 RND transporter [Actinoplanes ferrugineus]
MSSTPRARLRPGVVALSLVLLVSLTAASCGDDDDGVTVGAAARGTVDEIVEAPGSVTARAAATLSAPAAGTLTELRVEAGQRVSKGTVVAVIDSPELEARRESAAKALDQASRGGGSPGVSTSGFTAVRRKTDKQAASAFGDARAAATKITDPNLRGVLLKQVDAAEQQYTAASASAAATLRSVQRGVASLGQAVSSLSAAQKLQAQQAYDLADAAVEALTLRAPVAGTVQFGGVGSAPATGGASALSSLLSSAGGAAAAGSASTSLPGVDTAVPQGGYVAAGTPLMTIVDVSRLGLTAAVDETDVLLVQSGVAATVELDAATGATYPATVRAVDLLPTTSAQGGVSYRVRLDLEAGKYDDGMTAPTPRPGMSAVIRLQVRQAKDAVTVPASAIVNSAGRDTVWTVRDGRYQRVDVKVGVQGEDVVQVTSGLDAGQPVVVAGADLVRPGAEARS